MHVRKFAHSDAHKHCMCSYCNCSGPPVKLLAVLSKHQLKYIAQNTGGSNYKSIMLLSYQWLFKPKRK